MRSPHSIARLVALLGACVIAASCGTTLDEQANGVTQLGAGTTGATGEMGETGTDSTVVGTVPGGEVGGGEARGGDGTQTGGSVPGTTTGTAGVVGVVPIGQPSPGVTDEFIDIGVYTAAAAGNMFSSLGIKGLQTGDMVNQVESVVEWINENGGAAGRQVRIVFHDFDIGKASADPAAESQSACAAWTQDAKVFAVVAIVGNQTMDQLYSCLRNSNTIGVTNIGQTVDDGFMRRLGDHYYSPSTMTMTRAMRNTVQALSTRSFFDPSAPVGIVRYATPEDERAVNEGAIPALEALGLKAEVAVANPAGTGSEYQSIALRFKSLGVKNVIFTWTGTLSFASAAESLNYHPRWAITSFETPSLLPDNVPASQLAGAMGIGWLPVQDVNAAHDPGPVSERATLCFDIAAAAGEDMTSRSTKAILLLSCDPLMFLKEVLDRAAAPTVADFSVAAHSLGTSYASATTFRTLFGPGRTNDGGAGFRVIRYDRPCDCFVYDSDVIAAG